MATPEGFKISVYICAPSELVEMARRVAILYEREGIEVTSQWLKIEKLGPENHTPIENANYSMVDLFDINRAKMFVAINPFDWAFKGTGGRHVELGYAIALEKPIILYGDKTNIFHYHPTVHHIEDPGDLVKGTIKRFKAIQP